MRRGQHRASPSHLPTGKRGEAVSPVRCLWAGTREIISASLFPPPLEGSTPDAKAVSPDGLALFVANADNNSVRVGDSSNRRTEEAHGRGDTISLVSGFIPVGWYPAPVAVSPDNQMLLVAGGKGLASRANSPATTTDPRMPNQWPPVDDIARTSEGSIPAIARPGTKQMAADTGRVRKNSPSAPASLTQAPIASGSITPAKVGGLCPIKYVPYILEENRTYDEGFGDRKDAAGGPPGNGGPQLAIFGGKVTPNHHRLARDNVLPDNLYSNSEVSVAGHRSCAAAMATDFNQRPWIMSYSKHGILPGKEEMENPVSGCLWDLDRRHGLGGENYGEGA